MFNPGSHRGGNSSTAYSRRFGGKLAAFFLILFVVIVPLKPAVAQSGTDSSSSSPSSSDAHPGTDSSTVTPSPPSGSSADTPNVTPPDQSAGTASTDNSTNGTTGTSDENPSNQKTQAGPALPQGSGSPGPGSVATNFFNQTQFKIDQNTGAANITYPIVIPPGRNNLQPNVNLSYNSQNSQLGSIVGEGWAINIPYIQRLNKNGVDQLYSSSTPSYFLSTFDGELSTTTASTSSYVARTENGTFNKYTFSNNQWTMTDKNGTQYIFGSTSSSSQNDPNNASDTYKWMLAQVTDTNGNSVAYNYFKDAGQIYPSSTIYTNTSSTTGIFEVDFVRTSSVDNGTSSATGFAVNSNYRISEIDAKANGTWVRKYALGYTTGDNGSTTLLNWVAESGQNSSGTVVSLPSSTFSYQKQSPGWMSNSVWNPIISFTATSSADDGVRVADVNGDGLPDIIQGYTDANGVTSTAYINNGADWTISSTWNPPISFSANALDQGVRVADVNGDGLPDIIQGFKDAGGTNHYAAYINTGTGWVASSTWNPPVVFSNNGVDTGARIVDANGDGLPDIVQAYADTGGTAHYAAYINSGAGWTANASWNPPTIFLSSSTADLGVRIADVNGDGLPDIIQGYTDGSGSHYAAYMNTGNGWNGSSTATWAPPVSFANYGADSYGDRIVDVNGDGLADIVQAYTDGGGANHYTAYINNGAGWFTASAWNPPIPFTLNGTDNGTRIVDVNGDGLPDIIQAYTDSGGATHTAAYTNNNNFRADLLTNITYPQGGSSTISYESILQLTDSLGNVLNGVPYPVYIVSAVSNSDGFQNIATTTYVYYGGTYYTNGPFDHEFAGFTSVKQTDPAGNVTKTYYDTSNGVNSSTGQFADNFWKIGKPYRVENYDNANNLYKVTITKWNSASLGGNAAYVFPDQTLEMDSDGLSTHQDSAESYAWNSATGNQLQKIQWGQVTGSSTGAFATSTNGFLTTYGYASSTGSNVIKKVSDEILYNQSSTKLQESQYYYDSLSLGNVSAGNLTKEADWISGSTYANTQNTYNSAGLISQVLDPRNNTTTYSYDTYNLYPATTTNALSQTVGNQYDYSTGKPTQTVDPNKLVFQTQYDGLGRPLQVLQPDQVTTSTLDIKTTYAYTDTSGAVSVHEADYLNATTTVDTYGYYDGLNRLIQTRKSATDAGVYKVTDQAYNNVGLLQMQSLPYFATGSTKTAPTSTAALFTIYAYDPLGRVLTTVNAVGTVSNVYSNWKTATTDADGHQKDLYHDGYGNLVQVGEHNGTSTYATYYTFDGLKDLTNLTDANSNIRSFAYDGVGRMVSSTDLRAPTSSTYGTWAYTYDNSGNMITRLDPKNQTVNYTYEGLNRVLTEDYTGATGTEVMYGYDACTNGIGRLCTVTSTGAVSLITKTYDPLGNLASETKTISGVNYTTNYTYDRQGNQLTITNPDNSVIQYAYGTGGLPISVQEEEVGGSFNAIVSSIDYSPTDQIAIETYANGMVAKNIYDPLQLYRLVGKVTTDNVGQMGPLGKGGGNIPSLLAPSLNTSFTVTKRYVGAVDSFTVPIGVASLTVATYGGQGGSNGGLGGVASGSLSVVSGTTYYLSVGQMGGSMSTATPQSGAGGGGMTWFSAQNSFSTSTVLLVGAGGGGPAGNGDTTSYVSEPGGTGGYGGGGNGGSTNGSLPGGGGGGSGYWGGGGGGNQLGGVAGTQSSGYAVGQGGAGTNNLVVPGYVGGPGGSAGGLSGTAGGVVTDSHGFLGGGGGGGGSSYAANTLINTSTASAVNSGNGYVTITEYPATTVTAPYLSSQNQYHLDGVTSLGRGSSTIEGGVTLGAILNSSGTLGVQFQVEVEPIGKNFTNVPNVTSSPFMAPNRNVTTTFYGPNGSYHWQAQVVDVFGNSLGWQRFSSSTYTTDFILNSFQVTTTIPYTGSVASYTVPAGVTKLVISAYGAQGGGTGGLGGDASGTLLVTPGNVYYVNVGGQSGYSGGGTGGTGGGVGGGMTWFSATSTFSTSTVMMVAAGGGGSGTGSTGGTGGGTTGTSAADVNSGNASHGGAGGTQTAGGAGGAVGLFGGGQAGTNGYAGTGGNGGQGANCSCSYGGGGGGGFFGGGGGSGGANNGGTLPSAGGGGGSSFIIATSTLTNTSTASGVNSGNGSVVIVGLIAPVLTLSSLNQYHIDGVTPISDGNSTDEGKVIFGATLNSQATSSVQLQVEVQPKGTNFVKTANVTSSPLVSPGTNATTSFQGPIGNYHWQARMVDPQNNNTSIWQPFSTSTSTSQWLGLSSSPLYTDPNLLAYYQLENASDSKSNYNLTNVNSVPFDAAVFNNGADFGSANTNKVLNTTSSLGIDGGAMTVSFWGKITTPPASSNWEAFVQHEGPTSVVTENVFYYNNGGTYQLRFDRYKGSNGDQNLTVNQTLTPGVWYHIVMTYDGTYIRGYVNGAQVGTATAASGNGGGGISGTNFSVGMTVDSPPQLPLSGAVDDVGVFSRALTSTEIANLYTGTPISQVVDFSLSPILFTYPTNGTTTGTFSNWLLSAQGVTSTDSYQVQVAWGISQPNQATSSINTSGTQLLAGVSVPKQLFSGDYSDTGDPVSMTGLASLYDITGGNNFIATTTVNFYEKTIPATSNCTSSNVQCVAYTYDPNGNITQIVDSSTNSAVIKINYVYDALNRLTSASSSNALTGQNYLQTFTYDPVGNILSGPQGTYAYHGTNYTDPDAVTSITNGSTTSFTYDNNGNLINASSGFAYSWDYNNRLLTASSSNSLSSYGYDYGGQRVSAANAGVTTYYPETTYNANATTRTKNILANGTLVATVTNTTSTTGGAVFVQQATSTVSSGTSIGTSLAAAPKAGDILILTLGSNPSSSTISSISGGGVTWAKAVRSNTNRDAEIWYGLNSSGSGTFVTTTLSTACSGSCLVNISEWSGVATSSAVDATSTRIGSSVTLLTSPTSTTANASDLIIATERGTVASTLKSGPTGAFTALASASSSNGNSAYDIVKVTVATSTSWTVSSSEAFDSVIAAFKGTPTVNATATATNYVLTDHLGGVNLVTNVSGTILETLQYFPYGTIRIDNTTSSYGGNQRKYIGQMYDGQTQLDYLNARYLNPAQGQFISEDPVFLAIGSPQLSQLIGGHLSDILSNPQLLNAYSYAADNPITNKDPKGTLTQSQSAQLSALLSEISTLLQSLLSFVGRGGYGGGGGGNVGSTVRVASANTFSAINIAVPTVSSYNNQFAAVERTLVGKPYGWGDAGPDAVDCSGAIIYAIRQVANPTFPRYNSDQLYKSFTTPTNNTNAPGTLVFYDWTSGGVMNHVVTNVGGGFAVNPGGPNGVLVNLVNIDRLNNWTVNQGGQYSYAQLDWAKIAQTQ